MNTNNVRIGQNGAKIHHSARPTMYKGFMYNSVHEAAEAAGVSPAFMSSITNLGLSQEQIEQAIELKKIDMKKKKMPKYEVLGMKFTTLVEVVREFGIIQGRNERCLNHNTITKRLRGSSKVWDIELIFTYPDYRYRNVPKIEFMGVSKDGRGRYKVESSNKYVTALQLIRVYRPDLVNLYIKTNPKGLYHPYSKSE